MEPFAPIENSPPKEGDLPIEVLEKKILIKKITFSVCRTHLHLI